MLCRKLKLSSLPVYQQGRLSLYAVPLKSHGPLLSLLPSVIDDCVVCSMDSRYSAAVSYPGCSDLQTSRQSCTAEAIASKTPAFPQATLAQQPASKAKWHLVTPCTHNLGALCISRQSEASHLSSHMVKILTPLPSPPLRCNISSSCNDKVSSRPG